MTKEAFGGKVLGAISQSFKRAPQALKTMGRAAKKGQFSRMAPGAKSLAPAAGLVAGTGAVGYEAGR